jgi:hypothetical protein
MDGNLYACSLHILHGLIVDYAQNSGSKNNNQISYCPN